MKIYLDTSVYGGHNDKGMESSVELIRWLNSSKKKVNVYYSAVIRKELKRAPRDVLRVFQRIKNKRYLKLKPSVKSLSNLYIRTGALPVDSVNDALHVAVASVNRMDYILSWNMKHMTKRQNSFSEVNKVLSLNPIKILTPLNFLKEHHA